MCKLTKNLPIQGAGGLLDFQDSGRGFDKGDGKIQRGRDPRSRWSYVCIKNT